MNIAVIAFSFLAMSQMQRVSGVAFETQPCQSTDTTGFKGCECNILGACDDLDRPIKGLDYKFTGYAPIGFEQFSYAKSSVNLAYLCEGGAVTILYDCNAKIPLYAATLVNEDQLRGKYERGEDKFRQSTLLGQQFQQGPADYKRSHVRQACYENVAAEYLTEKTWYEKLGKVGVNECLICPISKGHMIASRYGKTVIKRMEATYTFTNIVPQFESFNNKEWKECEHYLIDEWGPQICASSVQSKVKMFIVVGAIPSTYTDPSDPRFFGKSGFSNFEGKSKRTSTYEAKSGGNEYRVNVPSYMWTAACCTFQYLDEQKELKDGTKRIAFYRSNDPGKTPCTWTTPGQMIKDIKTRWPQLKAIQIFPKNINCES